ncbi:uncharacterized protein PAC_16889 [Phialocephala subalpina]|uniref:Uncharacterized protein n=1 Tax=Phialocephala subalpina TaxID=576137 RepID=A0A1L7XPN1_9HELO|nr:uncharacterized protein PAC_16889 [Phialocephala subalpina]
MFPLSTDKPFHYELLRALALARYHGADINEVLIAASKIIPGDFESFHKELNDLAICTLSRADSINKWYPISAHIPSERILLQAGGFKITTIFYGAGAKKGERKPTLIIGNGFDGAQEEPLHFTGFATLEKGWNTITYEGPRQRSVVRNQGLRFITE